MCTSSPDLRQGPPPARSALRRILLAIVASLALVSITGVGTASAQDAQPNGPAGPGFTVSPYSEGNVSGVSSRSAFVLDASPGQTISDRVSVFNFTDAPITFLVYPADANPAKGTGAFSLQLPDATTGAIPTPVDVGKWIEVPVNSFTAQPGTRTDIPITVTVPLDAEPGDHAGGVVALNTAALQGSGDLKVDIKQAVGARMYVRVAGPLNPELSVSDVNISTGGQAWLAPFTGPSDATAHFTITNTGNVRMTPTVSVVVKDMFGRKVASQEAKDFQELLPGASLDATAALGDLSGFGPRYSVDITTTAGDTTQSSSTAFWVAPWLLLILLVVALAAFVVLRRRNRPATGSSGAGGGPGGERDPSSPAAGPAASARASTGLVGVGAQPDDAGTAG
jgi:hypothetical protein